MFDVNAVDADEYFVDEDLADALYSGWTNECEPVSTQETASNDHLQIGAMTQLHRDIHSVRQDRDSFVKTNAACNLRGSRTGANSEDVTVADQLRGEETDATFLGAALAFLLVIVGDVTKRLVEKWLNGHGAPMTAPQESAMFQLAQVPPNSPGGYPQPFCQSQHRDFAGAEQFLQD